MNEIKTFIADNLSGFSPKAIPGFIFSLSEEQFFFNSSTIFAESTAEGALLVTVK